MRMVRNVTQNFLPICLHSLTKAVLFKFRIGSSDKQRYLIAEDQDKHFWEAECTFTCHVVLNFFLHFLQVRLVVKLDPMRISNGDV